MSSTLKLHGDLTVGDGSSCGCSSFAPSIATNIDEALDIKGVPFLAEFELTTDSPVTVPFVSLTQAHAVFIKATGGKVRARLTSADGTSQAVPVDSIFFVISESVPFTGLDLTRQSGVSVTVRVLLAEKSS